jgi:hypothetical protein
MATLKDRQRQIPNGFRFRIPELNYQSKPFDSFDTIVTTVASIARSNPAYFTSKGWPTRRDEVAMWVDEFNARYCAEMGYDEYINGSEDSPPKHGPPPRAAALVAGGKSLGEWIAGGADPVLSGEAEDRASVCVKCPFNKEGDLSNFFERATSEMLRATIASAKELKLTTRFDDKLGVCDACYCPMKLKVWMPMKHILANMSPEILNELHPECWIRSEKK